MKPIHLIAGGIALVILAILVSGAFVLWRVLSKTTSHGPVSEASAHNLANVVTQFHLQYNAYPIVYQKPGTGIDLAALSDKAVMDVLLGLNAKLNPRLIAFGEWQDVGLGTSSGIIRTASGDTGGLVDSWGNPFRIVMDTDEDGRIADPRDPGAFLSHSVLVYSAGPDGDFDTWEDNRRTW